MNCFRCSKPARIAPFDDKHDDSASAVSSAMLTLVEPYHRSCEIVHHLCWRGFVDSLGLACILCAENVRTICGRLSDAQIVNSNIALTLSEIDNLAVHETGASVIHKKCLLRVRTRLRPGISNLSKSTSMPSLKHLTSSSSAIAIDVDSLTSLSLPPSSVVAAMETESSQAAEAVEEDEFVRRALRLSEEVQRLHEINSEQRRFAWEQLQISMQNAVHRLSPSSLLTSPASISLESPQRPHNVANVRRALSIPQQAVAAVHAVKTRSKTAFTMYDRWRIAAPVVNLNMHSREFRAEKQRILAYHSTHKPHMLPQTFTRMVKYVKKHQHWFEERVVLAAGDDIKLKRLLGEAKRAGCGRKPAFNAASRNLLHERIIAARESPEATVIDKELFTRMALEVQPDLVGVLDHAWMARICAHLNLSRRKITTNKNINSESVQAASMFYVLRFFDLVDNSEDTASLVASWRAEESQKESQRQLQRAEKREQERVAGEEKLREDARLLRLENAEAKKQRKKDEQAEARKIKSLAKSAAERKQKRAEKLSREGSVWRHQSCERFPHHRVINADETSVVLEDHGTHTIHPVGASTVPGPSTKGQRDTVTGLFAISMKGDKLTPTMVSLMAASKSKNLVRKAAHDSKLNKISIATIDTTPVGTLDTSSNQAALMGNESAYMTEAAVIEWLNKVVAAHIAWLDSADSPYGDQGRVFAAKPSSNVGSPTPSPPIRLLLLWDNMGAHCTDNVSDKS